MDLSSSDGICHSLLLLRKVRSDRIGFIWSIAEAIISRKDALARDLFLECVPKQKYWIGNGKE